MSSPPPISRRGWPRHCRRNNALGPVKDIQVNFDRELRTIQTRNPRQRASRASARSITIRTPGRFDVTLDLPTGATTRGTLHLDRPRHRHRRDRGRSRVRSSAAKTIKAADVVVERRARGTIGRDIVTDSEQGDRHPPRRNPMWQGRPLRLADLTKPPVVLRNETVTLTYQVPGITLTVRGKAAESGSEGDVISVLNEQSRPHLPGRGEQAPAASSSPPVRRGSPPTCRRRNEANTVNGAACAQL